MSDDRLPVRPDEIDAAWLTGALAERHPGVQVKDVEVVESHEMTNMHARLRIEYEEPAGAPAAMFCKLLPLDKSRRDAIAETGMGPLEVLFYASLASTLSMRVPAVYVAREDDRDGSFILLMEDLVSTGCRVSDGTWGVPIDAAAGALEDLADLHLRFVDPGRRVAEASWVPPSVRGGEYGAVRLREALDHHRDRISDDFAAISEIYIDRRDELQALWQSGPKTVIHGDTHIGNLFFDQGRTGFLDWGVIKASAPLRDVSYFLALRLVDRRPSHARTRAASPLSRDLECRKRHRDHLRRGLALPSDPRRIHGARVLSDRDVPAGHRGAFRVFSEAFLAGWKPRSKTSNRELHCATPACDQSARVDRARLRGQARRRGWDSSMTVLR